jgi:hypothetical protein
MINEQYNKQINIPSDIYQHLPTLYSYAKNCTSIAEFGVRGVVSTWALLKGLKENGVPSKHLICVDIDEVPVLHKISNEVRNEGINLQFIRENSVTVNIPVVDLLFIDTWHIYGHLKRELQAHHKKVRKYIIMHDTEIDKIYGESIRGGHDMVKQSIESGYPIEEIGCGLQKAINEFISQHPEWVIHQVFTNNNGLTILKRK